jgi:4-hydroxybenzoate polyprenyltransferase
VAFVTACNLGHIALWSVLILDRPLSALGWVLAAACIGAALAHAAWQFSKYRSRSREGSFAAFKHAHWLGFFLFSATVVSRQFV